MVYQLATMPLIRSRSNSVSEYYLAVRVYLLSEHGSLRGSNGRLIRRWKVWKVVREIDDDVL